MGWKLCFGCIAPINVPFGGPCTVAFQRGVSWVGWGHHLPGATRGVLPVSARGEWERECLGTDDKQPKFNFQYSRMAGLPVPKWINLCKWHWYIGAWWLWHVVCRRQENLQRWMVYRFQSIDELSREDSPRIISRFLSRVYSYGIP